MHPLQNRWPHVITCIGSFSTFLQAGQVRVSSCAGFSGPYTCYTLLPFQCCILENQLWSPFSYLCPTRVLWIFKGERGSRHNTYHDTQEQNSETSPASYIVQWKLNKNYSTKTYQRVAKLFESFNNSSQLQLSRELELRTSGGKHWLAATI